MSEDSIDPRQTFYLVHHIGNLDGTVQLIHADGDDAFARLTDAVVHRREIRRLYRGKSVLYECRPVKSVRRLPL